VRWLFAGVAALLSGCGPGLIFNNSQQMTPDQMLARADRVFVGTVRSHHFDSWPFFRVPGVAAREAKYWMVLRRVVRVELALRGGWPGRVVDVYEIYWDGPASGDWNSTRGGERDVFLVRRENGRYHVVRDWWRSIFPVTSGRHTRLPLDESRPLWERIALMNWWVDNDPAAQISYPHFLRNDPGGALTIWRTTKLLRGLVRHPSSDVRMKACRELMQGGIGQDECWDDLSMAEKGRFHESGYICCSQESVAETRTRFEAWGAKWWNIARDRDQRRLLTTVSNRRLRAEFCGMFEHEYPGDLDNGCPATNRPPATIVTEQGDVPLVGAWPQRSDQQQN
jgi:hypothetical protein